MESDTEKHDGYNAYRLVSHSICSFFNFLFPHTFVFFLFCFKYIVAVSQQMRVASSLFISMIEHRWYVTELYHFQMRTECVCVCVCVCECRVWVSATTLNKMLRFFFAFTRSATLFWWALGFKHTYTCWNRNENSLKHIDHQLPEEVHTLCRSTCCTRTIKGAVPFICSTRNATCSLSMLWN